MKTELYVPTMIPSAMIVTKSRIVSPPSRIRATSTRIAVSEVLSERASVWFRLALTAAERGGLNPATLRAPDVLADAVEDNDGVMDTEADDGEHRGDEQRIDLEVKDAAQDRRDTKDDDDVVAEGNNCGRAVTERTGNGDEGKRDVEQDGNRRGDDGKRGVACDVGGHGGRDGRELEESAGGVAVRID